MALARNVRPVIAAEDSITGGWEARQPCRAATFDGPAGTLPPSRAGIGVSRKGVLVTAFGPNPDGTGTILRLWEQIGSDGPCRVKLPDGMRPTKARQVDLRGRPAGEAIAVQDGEMAVPMARFAPASLLLE
jgi:alpha-mannosidase